MASKVEINLTNEFLVTGGSLETVFKASRITFHWGKCNISHDGSEHSINGQKYPLEMQIYCYDAKKFVDIDKAIEENGKLRALSILFEVGLEDNNHYKSIIDGVASVSRFGKKSELDPFILLNLLPNATDKYYTYNGSLSSPPCSETVEWIIFKDPVNISENQGAILNNLLPNTSYVLQIVAVCANGLYGKYSDQVIVDMPLDDPEIELFPDLTETEDYEEEDEMEEARVSEEAAVITSTDSIMNQIRKKEFQVTTSSYNQERMGTQFNEAGTHRYLAKEEDSYGKNDQSKAIFHASQPTTEEPKEEEVDSTESQATTAVVLPASSSTKGNGEEYAHAFSDNETTGASAADSHEDDIEVSAFKPDLDTDDSWGSIPTTSATWLVTVETSQESIISSGSPEMSMHEDISQGYIKIPSEDLGPPRAEESAEEAPTVNVNLWYRWNGTDTTAISVDSKQLFQSSSPDPATVLYPNGPVLSPEVSVADIELPHSSTFAFSPTYSVSPNSEEHGSASAASEILSQTTQPVYNGEIPLQPSYSSEVFPLVTPLLSDAPMRNTSPAASSSDVTLHATPVFPSVDVSFESTPTSSGDVPLLPFSSASSSSKMFHHLYMVSQAFPQAAPAAESDKVPLHASLTFAEGGALMQSSLAPSSDVTPHQMVRAASETLIFGHGRTRLLSQVEPSSSDLNMHAVSPMSELAYALSGNVSSLQTVAASYYTSELARDSVGASHQGPLSSSYTHVLVRTPSSAISQADTLPQPTCSLSSKTDWSEAYSGSESLLPETDIMSMPKAYSHDSAGELICSTPGFSGDVEKPLKKGVIYGYNRELQISSFSEMASPAESVMMTELPTTVSNDEITKQDTPLQEILIAVSSAKGTLPGPIAFPVTKVFDYDDSKLSENHIPVQLLHVTTPALDDTLLKPALSVISEQAFSTPASSNTLSPSLQYHYEASATLNNALLQTSFQPSDDGSLLRIPVTVPSDQVSIEKNAKADSGSSAFDQILHRMAPDPAVNKTRLHSASESSTVNKSHATSNPTNSPEGLNVSYINGEQISPSLLNNEDTHQVGPSFYGHDVSNQSTNLENTSAFPSKSMSTAAVPVVPTEILPYTATSANSHSLLSVPQKEEFLIFSSRANIVEITAPVPENFSDSSHIPDMNISVTLDPPRADGSITSNILLLPTKVVPELSTTTSSDTDLWLSVVDDDYDEYDSGLLTNGCHRCISHRETQEEIDEPDTQVDSDNNKNNLIINSHFETSEENEAKKTTIVLPEDRRNHEVNQLKYTTGPAVVLKTKKHSDAAISDNHIQTGSNSLQNAPNSKSWAVFTNDEESGSGQGASDSLNENETSTDFSFSDLNDHDFEGAVGAGKSELTSGAQQSSVASIPSGHASVFNISEAG
ncbi:hypothetical protein lerEdw1_004046 [Lerista edwardsae]|nr:hypothetical protein lerEdw1_004046 [Lerista edwardsae]